MRGGLTLSGAMLLTGGATVAFDGEPTFAGGTIQFGEGGRVLIPEASQLTLAPSALVHGKTGRLEGVGALRNQGKISADVAGGTIRVTVTTFTNTGTLEANNGGTLVAPRFP